MNFFQDQTIVITEKFAKHCKHHALIVDVREPEEYATGHIEGSINIPLGTLNNTLFVAPKNATVVFHCQSGRRTGTKVPEGLDQATKDWAESNRQSLLAWAKDSGFKQARFIMGGMNQWKDEWVLPTVTNENRIASPRA